MGAMVFARSPGIAGVQSTMTRIFHGLLLALTLVPFSPTFGAPTQESHYGVLATQIVDSLLTRFPTCKVDAFDFCQLRRKIEEVKWETAQRFAPPETAGTRSSAYYLPSEKRVVVSPFLFDSANSEVPTLALHEALGAMGIDDRHYQLSLMFALVARTSPDDIKTDFILQLLRIMVPARPFHDQRIALAGGGGSTSVAGGGDVNALLIKYEVLLHLLKSSAEFYPSFFVWFLNHPYEPSYDDTDQWIRLQPGSSIWPLYSTVVPIHIWINKPQLRKQMIRELSEIAEATEQKDGKLKFETLHRCGLGVMKMAVTRPPLLKAIVPRLIKTHVMNCRESNS